MFTLCFDLCEFYRHIVTQSLKVNTGAVYRRDDRIFLSSRYRHVTVLSSRKYFILYIIIYI